MDDKTFRKAMGKFATGVTVIMTQTQNETYGMTANAFMSVSLDPKLVLISVHNRAKIKPFIETSGQFSVNILADEQKELAMIFAGQINKNQGIQFKNLEGHPVIKDSLVSLICSVYNAYVEGDHTLFIGEVINLTAQDGIPLTYYEGNYQSLTL